MAIILVYTKCGFNWNTKQRILFGLLELGGAHFRPLYNQQGIRQIQLFIYHWRSQTQAGRLLLCAVTRAQYCAGRSTPILEKHTHSPCAIGIPVALILAHVFITYRCRNPSVPNGSSTVWKRKQYLHNGPHHGIKRICSKWDMQAQLLQDVSRRINNRGSNYFEGRLTQLCKIARQKIIGKYRDKAGNKG